MLKALGVGGAMLAAGVPIASAKSHREVGDLELLYEFERPNPGTGFPGVLPENVAIDKRGNKYVSIASLGQIWKFSPGNELVEAPFTEFQISGDFLVGTIGLEVTPKGTIYVCFASDLATSQADTNGVWVIEPGEDPELFAEISSGTPAPTFPNDLILFGDSLLVTDSFLGVVWQVRKNETTVWCDSPLLAPPAGDFGADGIQLSKDRKTVYVTNIATGTIVAIPVEKDGSAGEAYVFVDGLAGADGLAMDVKGYLYAADNRGNRIVRISPGGSVETLASNPVNGINNVPLLDAPADVTFGTTGGEQTAVFIPNLAFSDDPKPSFMKLDVGVPGYPVHR